MRRVMQFIGVALLVTTITATAVATGTQEDGSADEVFQFALSGSPDTLDPHATAGTLTFQVIRSVYDTLVEPNADGEIVPALAEAWTVSPDNLVWEFDLRDGVRFHNGDLLTSADVKATLDRLIAGDTHSSAFAVVDSIETPDPDTVVLTLNEPSAPLMAELASGWGAILPASLIASGHDFNTQPVGTGPFEFVEWVQDNRIVFARNDSYWLEGAPSLAGVVFNVVPEGAVRAQGLISGDFHAIESFNEADQPMLEANPNVKIERDLSTLVMVLAMNTSRQPLDQLQFRQAVAQAIDKQSVMDVAYGGGEIVGTFMDVGNAFYVDFTDIYPYDPTAAEDRLAGVSYDDSEPLVMALPSNYEAHVRAGEMYHQMLTNIGLNVELQLVDWSTWISDVYRGGNYDFTVIGHTGKLDPQGRIGGMGRESYYVRWVDGETQSLIQEAGRVVDFPQRRELYSQALENIARAVPHVYVGSSYRDIALRENVYGFYQDVQIDTYDFRFTEIR